MKNNSFSSSSTAYKIFTVLFLIGLLNLGNLSLDFTRVHAFTFSPLFDTARGMPRTRRYNKEFGNQVFIKGQLFQQSFHMKKENEKIYHLYSTATAEEKETLVSLENEREESPEVKNSQSIGKSETTTNSRQAPATEIERRRNFAIISHPDSGKTTLTEKLLLYGGAINQAGAVRSRASQRSAKSDWMEMEQQRGISITSTVLSFDYNDYRINLLDTPGHQDFSEDTYRTLSAADNSVMLVDGAKGLETQTKKLFDVCRLRGLPVYTFINKMDRPAKDPLDLIDEIEREMGIECCPIIWPIGSGEDFKGVYDRFEKKIYLYERTSRTERASEIASVDMENPNLKELLSDELYDKLQEDIEVLEGIFPELNMEKVKYGKQSPIFFGSAMNNFGVELFLKKFLKMSDPPGGRESTAGLIGPDHNEFSGFVFKLQANLNPKHRDRVAFIRICSGKFEKGLKVSHSRTKKSMQLSQAQQLFAQERETVELAYPGDVIGLNNPGTFAIGDTIHTGTTTIKFPGIPSFSPECFAYIRNPNPSKYKNYKKGIDELMEEGAVQLLYERHDEGCTNPILAAVGNLQFEVVTHRLQAEYGVESELEPLSFTAARWSEATWEDVDKANEDGKIFGTMICKDRYGRPVLLFRNSWKIESVTEENKDLKLVPWAMAPEYDIKTK